MAQDLTFRPPTSDIPTAPGVYRFLDSTGRILYVGKAKNLRNRLTSYFAPLQTLTSKTQRMLRAAADVTWTVVTTELEALQLEFTWIKEFDPPYNVQFTDDKSYPYLAMTMEEEVPRVFVTRNRKVGKVRYFGPFTKTWAIRETLDLLLKAFPMRSCSTGVYDRAAKAKRPCLLGDIGKCSAPCAGRVTIQEHREIADQFAAFMSGTNDLYVEKLRNLMVEASEKQEYERAARLRDAIQALDTIAEKSAVVLSNNSDCDVIAVASDGLTAAVQQFIVRGGRIRGVRSWLADGGLDLSVAEIMHTAVRTAYSEADEIPRDIVLSELPEDADSLQMWLTSLRKQKSHARATVNVRTAPRGDLAQLLRISIANAQQQLQLYRIQRARDYVSRSQSLTDLQEALGLPEAPLRIECYDISHLSGTGVVGSMVVFEDALPKKRDYRSFTIAEANDDTTAMNQVLSRRARYLTSEESAEPEGSAGERTPGTTSFSYRPGLILVDGGLPQVNAAQQALTHAGIDVPVAGLAKRLEEVWVSGQPHPIIFSRDSDALFLLQQLRDEAHRFAIFHQRSSRKKNIHTVLAEIPGLGPAKVSKLLKQFGSVSKLKQASAEDIGAVPGITQQLAERIRKHLSQS